MKEQEEEKESTFVLLVKFALACAAVAYGIYLLCQ